MMLRWLEALRAFWRDDGSGMPAPRQTARIKLREDAAVESQGRGLYWAVCFTEPELRWLREKLTGHSLAERVQSVLDMAQGDAGG